MNARGPELLVLLQDAPDADQLFARVVAHAGELGFEYVCYGFQAQVPVIDPPVTIFETYPSGWMDHYRRSEFLTIDPAVRLGRHTPCPIVWTDRLFESAQRLWDDARDFGLATGISQPGWGANGVFGLLSFARSDEIVMPAEARALTERLNWLMAVTHTLMSRFRKSPSSSRPDIPLTPREKEVLRWSADGKTAAEIGAILNIAERTATFHINNIIAKLNVTNKVQATVRGILLGLVEP